MSITQLSDAPSSQPTQTGQDDIAKLYDIQAPKHGTRKSRLPFAVISKNMNDYETGLDPSTVPVNVALWQFDNLYEKPDRSDDETISLYSATYVLCGFFKRSCCLFKQSRKPYLERVSDIRAALSLIDSQAPTAMIYLLNPDFDPYKIATDGLALSKKGKAILAYINDPSAPVVSLPKRSFFFPNQTSIKPQIN